MFFPLLLKKMVEICNRRYCCLLASVTLFSEEIVAFVKQKMDVV